MFVQKSKSQFVAVASIAAELSAVMDVAKEISLAAANAKAIAFRAGEKAKGFQPITDFINHLAKDTITLVNSINDHASKLYRMTVNEQRMVQGINHFEKALTLAEGAVYKESMQTILTEMKQRKLLYHLEFENDVAELLEKLSEIMHPARAARVIAANSRIEASQAGEYLQSLQAVAESVDHAAQIINTKVNRCRSALNMINTRF